MTELWLVWELIGEVYTTQNMYINRPRVKSLHSMQISVLTGDDAVATFLKEVRSRVIVQP